MSTSDLKPNVLARFSSAENHVSSAVMDLVRLRADYERGDHGDKRGRVVSLTAKIDALKAVGAGLNPNAHPWLGDWKETP